jgi:hypothetical protein
MIHKLKTYPDPVMDREFRQLYDWLRKPFWNDINFSAANLRPGDTTPTWQKVNGDIYGFVFSDSIMNDLIGAEELLHGYLRGSDIKLHLHWKPLTTSTGVCRWGLEYAWTNIGGDTAASTIIYAEQAGAGVAGRHQILSFPDISGAGKQYGSCFECRIFRDAAHANDTLTGGAHLIQFGIHYQSWLLGSEEVYAQNVI